MTRTKQKFRKTAKGTHGAIDKHTNTTNSDKEHDHKNIEASRESVYKRVPSYPKPYHLPNVNDFIKPSHPKFNEIVATSYEGFTIDDEKQLIASIANPNFNQDFERALLSLEDEGFYQFDYTQPGGLNTKVAKTYVSRCLVGNPGMTYKYLGLRMFALPWTRGSTGATEAMISIGALNDQLIDRSKQLNIDEKNKHNNTHPFGSCEYNLTLINRCYPHNHQLTSEGDDKVKLKKEPIFNKQLCSVSWHADSCLEHYSSIAVYHFDQGNADGSNSANEPWQIAVRVQINAEGPHQGKPPSNTNTTNTSSSSNTDGDIAPAIAVALPKRCCYYLLDEFNHHHQHTVLAGGSGRFASTHRVSRVEGHSYAYIKDRAQQIMQEKFQVNKASVRKLLLVSAEVEIEWVRQFYVQGVEHFNKQRWWHEPMQTLVSRLVELERRLFRVVAIMSIMTHSSSYFDLTEELKAKKKSNHSEEQQGQDIDISYKWLSKVHMQVKGSNFDLTQDAVAEMITLLEERQEKRRGFLLREQDSIFATAPEQHRPMPVPLEEMHNIWQGFATHLINSSNKPSSTSSVVDHAESNKFYHYYDAVIAFLRSIRVD